MNRNFHYKPTLTRLLFESLILGNWEDKRVGGFSYRANGKFKTWKHSQWKFVSDGKSTLRAKTWWELARALELV